MENEKVLQYCAPAVRPRFAPLAIGSAIMACVATPIFCVFWSIVGIPVSGMEDMDPISQAVILALIPAMVAIVTGIVALRRIRRANGLLKGRLFAWIGVVCPAIFFLYLMIAFIIDRIDL